MVRSLVQVSPMKKKSFEENHSLIVDLAQFNKTSISVTRCPESLFTHSFPGHDLRRQGMVKHALWSLKLHCGRRKCNVNGKLVPFPSRIRFSTHIREKKLTYVYTFVTCMHISTFIQYHECKQIVRRNE